MNSVTTEIKACFNVCPFRKHIYADTNICTRRLWLWTNCLLNVVDVSTLENLALLIFCHICTGSIRPFRSCLSLLLVTFLVNVKASPLLGCLWSWWIPALLMASHADPLMGVLKCNLWGYFLSLARAQCYNHNHVDTVNPITQSTLLPWTVNCQILSWVPDDLLPQ